jgi:YebC/PmpR family DNA-binding regulatory protein
MAGHSKWANTKHRKKRQDGLRQKAWGKLLKEITVAAKLGGGDPDANPRLRAAIAKSKSQSLPNKNIDSAIKHGIGSKEGENHEVLVYEGYGLEGTAFIVTTLTDNKARTAQDVRYVFSKYGGSMGETGAVAWSFKHQVHLVVSSESLNEELWFDILVTNDGDDLIAHDDVFELFFPPNKFGDVLKTLEEKQIEPLEVGLVFNPTSSVEITMDSQQKSELMIEKFEDLDDVQEVFHNIKFLEDKS